MSGKFPNLTWWLWSGKNKNAKKLQNKSSLKSSAKSSDLELNSKRVKRKGRNHEDPKIRKGHDSVVVPFDGGESSGDCESDGSDWSIGWSEPHAPGFLSEDEIDSGFGVLVRCYGRTSAPKTGISKNSLGGVSNDPNAYETDSQKHIDRWLSTLQGGN